MRLGAQHRIGGSPHLRVGVRERQEEHVEGLGQRLRGGKTDERRSIAGRDARVQRRAVRDGPRQEGGISAGEIDDLVEDLFARVCEELLQGELSADFQEEPGSMRPRPRTHSGVRTAWRISASTSLLRGPVTASAPRSSRRIRSVREVLAKSRRRRASG